MRLHGLLSWYDEPPSMLAACIAGLHKAGIDHLVAVDGAYLLYPDGTASSPPDQHATIQQTCQALGIGVTIHVPQERWTGNEVEKRTAMFQVAHAISEPGDWWLIMDADQIVTHTPPDLKQQLEQTDLDVAEVMFWENRDLDTAQEQARQFEWARKNQWPIRILFRAQPLHCDTNHYTYITDDDRKLWASDSSHQEPCLTLHELKVEHRHQLRPLDRKASKNQYYKLRDDLGIERGPCCWRGCEKPGTQIVGAGFKIDRTRGGFIADLRDVCDEHHPKVVNRNRIWLRQHGIDPDEALNHTQFIDA